MSEKPEDEKLTQDIDRAIEELEAAARALTAPEGRRALKALSDAAKAVATIQDAVKAVALQDAAKAVALSTSGDALRELVADEVKRALAISGQAAQQAGGQPKTTSDK